MKARSRPDDVPKGFTKRGNKYWTRVPGDAKREVGHHDLVALVKWKAAYKQALIDEVPLPPVPGEPGFARPRAGLSFRQYATDVFMPRYRERGNLSATTRQTEKRLARIAGFKWAAWPIAGIREDTLRAWAAEIEASEAPATARRMRGLVWCVFDRAAKDPDVPLTGNPASDIRPPVDRGARRGQLKQTKRGVLELEHVAALATLTGDVEVQRFLV